MSKSLNQATQKNGVVIQVGDLIGAKYTPGFHRVSRIEERPGKKPPVLVYFRQEFNAWGRSQPRQGEQQCDLQYCFPAEKVCNDTIAEVEENLATLKQLKKTMRV